jgi:hypothetical protein
LNPGIAKNSKIHLKNSSKILDVKKREKIKDQTVVMIKYKQRKSKAICRKQK